MKDKYYLKNELYELVETDKITFDFIQEQSLDWIYPGDNKSTEKSVNG